MFDFVRVPEEKHWDAVSDSGVCMFAVDKAGTDLQRTRGNTQECMPFMDGLAGAQDRFWYRLLP